MKNRVFVIGLDGATFDVINPLVQKGDLPNIAGLMQHGSWGPLKSTIPAFSPVAWTSMITGVNPGKHGIVDAFIHHSDYRMSFVNSTYRRYKPIWSLLNSLGKSTGVVNVPLTYPPEQVNGFLITGMFTPEHVQDFVYPDELGKRVHELVGKYNFEAVQSPNMERVIKSTYDVIAQRDKIFSYLLSAYDMDFYFFVFVETDRIQHYFWKFMQEDSPNVSLSEKKKYGNIISDIYKRLDDSIGMMLKYTRDEDTIMLVSDHGFGPMPRAFALSNWLRERGYTRYRSDKEVSVPEPPSLFDKVKKRLLRRPEDGDKEKALNWYFENIDWHTTTAFTEGASGGIFINMVDRQKQGIIKAGNEYEYLRRKIISELKELRDPSTGKRVVKDVYRREDIYATDDFTGVPDLIVICEKEYHTISPSECAYYRLSGKDMFFPHSWSGRHEENGIFVIKGPMVKPGFCIENANIMDISPTILYLMDKPISPEFDGKVLLDAFDKDWISAHHPRYAAEYTLKLGGGGTDFSEEESQQIEERLKNLGYL